jgi:hypothetical protein
VALDPLRGAHTEGLRLQEAIDTEYRTARWENTWSRAQPQILERWRTALRAWTLAAEAALGADQAALGRFRAARAAAGTQPGENVDWLQVRSALAGKLAALGAILEERKGSGNRPGGATPPRRVWRKR